MNRPRMLLLTALVGLLAAALPLGASLPNIACAAATAAPPAPMPRSKWTQLQQLFNQDPDYLHFSNFLITSHPKPVREAIERHRAALDHPRGDQRHQVVLGGLLREGVLNGVEATLLGHAALCADIGMACRIITDNDDREARLAMARGLQPGCR